MRYAYNKKTYKLKHKLKILLTILLAALISTTGYLLSRDAYSSPTGLFLNIVPYILVILFGTLVYS